MRQVCYGAALLIAGLSGATAHEVRAYGQDVSQPETLPGTQTESKGIDPWRLLELAISPAHAAANVTITTRGGYRHITSTGVPDHRTGRFPNRNNPNRISPQTHKFRVPLAPRIGGTTRLRMHPFGVAVNGIPFDPGAAEFWKRNPRSGWQYEAMSGAVNLGLDGNNAHVQPTGAYHYHGLPTALFKRFKRSRPALLGYAADGFAIYGPSGYRDANDPKSGVKTLSSGYRIKRGRRSGGPGGKHDGTFTRDYEHVAGRGDLDACNGRRGVTPDYPSGTYYYVITTSYPFIPRCFKGRPDPSFTRLGGRRGPQSRRDGRRGPPPGAGHRPPRGGAFGRAPPPPGGGLFGRPPPQ